MRGGDHVRWEPLTELGAGSPVSYRPSSSSTMIDFRAVDVAVVAGHSDAGVEVGDHVLEQQVCVVPESASSAAGVPHSAATARHGD